MTPIRLLASTIAVVTLASCSTQPDYDTSNPYGTADGGTTSAASTPAASSNPVYDTPAAYEENSGSSHAVPDASVTSLDTAPTPAKKKPTANVASTPTRAATKPSAAVAHSGGTTHTVVKGDSLWIISKKYKVPAASIKAANHMTSDTVVLGKKLIIPAN